VKRRFVSSCLLFSGFLALAPGTSTAQAPSSDTQVAAAALLAMPENPATLYVLTGSAFDPEAGEVAESYLRYVVYMPWATVESTGLSVAPMGPGSPWLMYPGTAGAHVMISPPRTTSGG